jgi:hypothetical protein
MAYGLMGIDIGILIDTGPGGYVRAIRAVHLARKAQS